jgi:hypothetical protein
MGIFLYFTRRRGRLQGVGAAMAPALKKYMKSLAIFLWDWYTFYKGQLQTRPFRPWRKTRE